jgi:inner membrane protein involved in colicin E2 resistance
MRHPSEAFDQAWTLAVGRVWSALEAGEGVEASLQGLRGVVSRVEPQQVRLSLREPLETACTTILDYHRGGRDSGEVARAVWRVPRFRGLPGVQTADAEHNGAVARTELSSLERGKMNQIDDLIGQVERAIHLNNLEARQLVDEVERLRAEVKRLQQQARSMGWDGPQHPTGSHKPITNQQTR